MGLELIAAAADVPAWTVVPPTLSRSISTRGIILFLETISYVCIRDACMRDILHRMLLLSRWTLLNFTSTYRY